MAQEDNLLGFGFFSLGLKEDAVSNPYDGLSSVEIPESTSGTLDKS